MLRPDDRGEKLILDLIFPMTPPPVPEDPGPADEPHPGEVAFSQAGAIAVRLHRADGRVFPPSEAEDRIMFGISTGAGGGSGYATNSFPWPGNDLEEAWLEVRLGQKEFRLTIPYGFLRDPAAPLGPPRPDLEGPRPVPVEAARGAQVVPWEKVIYELGGLDPAESISVRLANPFYATCVVTLYRFGTAWSLDSPRTAAFLLAPDGGRMEFRIMERRLDKDGMRRHDRFEFHGFGGPEGRFWGTLRILVGEHGVEFAVPSSTFKYTHGRARPRPAGTAGAPAATAQ